MATVWELKDSGKFRVGPGGFSGSLLYLVTGGTTEQAAYTLVEAAAPENMTAPNGVEIIRGDITVDSISGGGIFKFAVEYSSTIRSAADEDYVGNPSGSDPGPQGGGGEGGGNPAGGAPASEPVGREFSLSTGGGTERIFLSKATKYSAGENVAGVVQAAPNSRGIIGLPSDGGGQIQGCDVVSPTCEFTLAARFQTLEKGYILRLMATTGKTNSTEFLSCYAGEVLFLGADIEYRDGDERPWRVSGRFRYSAHQGEVRVGDITLLDVGGHDYIWFLYQKREVGGKLIDVPAFGYVERVYDQEDFRLLGMEI